ncbi:hypothetical protein I350_04461 [Cryptococcus amylolentus CBS 6273]|uniref:Nuclear pore complex protein Nup205 n=1 Tax=Cryptococcus amylolentus CBS 6273 TaxID=1296118 RepID=A0A1E3K4D3_9TREE|nr:hypothetical protein I350_04461 [Cryptococcus amylolentus CBS 6273]
MSSLTLLDWDPTTFALLQQQLTRVISQPTTSALRKLWALLEGAEPWLLNLTRLPPKNDKDKEYIEKNALELPSGTTIRVTGDLLTTTNTISDALSLSQLYSAVLALQAESHRHQYPSRSTPEISIYLLHQWSLDLLVFLEQLFRVVISQSDELDTHFEPLKNFVENLLGSKTEQGTLIDNILSQLDVLHSKLSSLLSSQSPSGPAFELLQFRVQALRAEQNKLASILGVLAEGGRLGRGQVVRILKWLKKVDRADGVVGMVGASLMAAWKPLESMDASDGRYDVAEDWCHDIKFLKLASSLTLQEQWTIPRLREPIKLAWSLFYLSCLRHDPSVIQTGIDQHEIEGWLLDSVHNDALALLHAQVVYISGGEGAGEVDVLVQQGNASEVGNNDFLVEQVRGLVDILAGKKQFLRNLRNKEEDTGARRSQVAPPAAHYQNFLRLTGAVYKSLPPDSAVELWENSTFTSTVLDSRNGLPGTAFWEMLAAISTGPECSVLCYEKLKDTRLPWTSLFKFYQHYIEIMPHIYEPIKSTRAASLAPMVLEDVEVCTGWTKVLETVVRWSPAARAALLQSKPQPLGVLFEFLNCDNVPISLKATILQAITAFTKRTSDPSDDEIISQSLSSYEKITYLNPALDVRHLEPGRIPQPVGWLSRMEWAENEEGRYALSRAYVEYLTELVPSPGTVGKPAQVVPSGLRSKLVNTLRRGAYQVIDGVFLSLKTRRYARDSERWEVLDTLTAFLEKALLSFSMSELLSPSASASSAVRTIGPIAVELSEEPGFVILLRLLSDPAVFAVLASVLDSAAQEGLDGQGGKREEVVSRVLLRVLRVYHRVLEVQLVFAEVLLVILADSARNPTYPFKRPFGLQPLDNHILSHLSNITTIALLVADDDPAISYIATKLVATLSASPVFNRTDIFQGEYAGAVNRLAGILDASDDSIRISQAFVRKLDVEGDAVEDQEVVEDEALHGDVKKVEGELGMVTRSVILDILVEGTTQDVSSPNIAHFLLGYDFRHRDFALQSGGSSCLHVILRQLLDGAELCGPSGDGIIDRHPLLGAKSAELIYQLFSHPMTGRATMGYAMSVTGYSARQLASIPRRCVEWAGEEGPSGRAVYWDGSVNTTSDVLVAVLEFQRWIVSSASLETFSYDGHGASAARIAEILFYGSAHDEDELDGEQPQTPPLLIDLLSSFDVRWEEPELENRQLEFFAGFGFDEFKRAGVEWWDLKGLEQGMKAWAKGLERQGAITPASAPAVQSEIIYVLQKLGGKNKETDVAIAKGNFALSWNELLKISLAMLFKHINPDEQQILLFSLLDQLLLRLLGADELSPGVGDVIAESVLVAMTQLVTVLGVFEGVNLPVELLGKILGRVVDGATRPGTTETARGNLYAAITQFLTLISPQNFSDSQSLAPSSFSVTDSTPSLLRTTLTVLAGKKERFIPTLCRDAMDDRDVWKTECYALLGGIVGLCQGERERFVLEPLMKGGYLPLVVRSVKEKEGALLECLGPEAENLHAYWVFESKLAFLLALASTRKGAEDLLDSGLFEILATCGFINVQIQASEEALDEVEAAEILARQHRVLGGVLGLVARVLASLHRGTRSGASQAIGFLNAHREAVLALIREPQQSLSTSSLEECRTVVSILALVVHKVSSDELHSLSSFGAFHMAVLATAAGIFDRTQWVEAVDEEPKLEGDILSLNQSLLSFLTSATSSLKSGSGNPVFITGVHRSHSSSVKYIASAPSVGTAVNLLGELVEKIQEVGGEWEVILERMEEGGDLDEADVEKLRNEYIGDSPLSDDLIKSAFISKTQTLFDMIESLLLLIWRHLLFYANDARSVLAPSAPQVRPDNLSISLSGSAFGASRSQELEGNRQGAGIVRMLERVGGSLSGVLLRVGDLEINPELRRLATSSSSPSIQGDAFFDMLVRRLKELVGGLVGDAPAREEGEEEGDALMF